MATRRPQRRRPAPRRRTYRTRRRRQGETPVPLLAACALTAAVAWAVISWLVNNWWVLILLGAVAAVGGVWWAHRYRQRRAWDRVRQQALRYGLPQLDALHHRDFEYAVRDLMRRDGCTDARQIGGAGDNGADVLATDPHGRTWVIQCKHRVRHEVALFSGRKVRRKAPPSASDQCRSPHSGASLATGAS
ncbi:restriction endonuclease [Streptomyces sp. ITFR-16]|uniref:restriction endonuclease n=1 Tax=Streptomyces sp. ITFR-16 TaxID=3075198 RepID=UPI00288B5A9A|nr:restriction endonuclease [Streptomyces sp. ITFR-16]WNI20452.1 restriction endonuclease [Streptomyces sp. ITFR-16]